MTSIGFLILSHRDQRQLLWLTETLNALYGHPPIACHHDTGQASLSVERYASNVRFVLPSLRTGWAKWSVVEAALAALRLLYEDSGPDWFVLLSAADYPIRPPADVLDELGKTNNDAFVDARSLGTASPRATLNGQLNPQLTQFALPQNLKLKWRHHVAAQFWFPIIRRKPRWRFGRHTVHLPYEGSHPFGPELGYFFGDHWFTANRRCAEVLLNPTAEHLKLQRHMRTRAIPEEGYYQTVLCNTPGLSIDIDNKRFAEWNGGGAHPMELTARELPAAFASGAHFARKFAMDSPALDLVDERLGLKATASATRA